MKKKKIILLWGLCAMAFLLMNGCTQKNKDNKVKNQSVQRQQSSENNEPSQSIQSNDEEQNEESQKEQNDADTKIQADQENDKLEELLKSFREEREPMTAEKRSGGLLGFGGPNEEDYDLGVGNLDYTSRFDSRESGEAYEAAIKYVEETLKIKIESNATVYPCIDPRIFAIYDDEDKGVASGYDANNIFICEYCDDGEWQYLILVRDGKGEPWKVIHHGTSYKE